MVTFQYLRSETQYSPEIVEQYGQPSSQFGGNAVRATYDHFARFWFWGAGYTDRDENFRADSGFIPRVDLRQATGYLQRRFWGTGRPVVHHVRPRAPGRARHRPRRPAHRRRGDGDGAVPGADAVDGPGRGVARERAVRRRDVRGDGRARERVDQAVGRVRAATEHAVRRHRGLHEQPARDGGRPGPRHRVEGGGAAQPAVDALATSGCRCRPGGSTPRTCSSSARSGTSTGRRSSARSCSTPTSRATRRCTSQPTSAKSSKLFSQYLFSYKLNPQTVLLAGYSDNYLGGANLSLTQTNRTLFIKVGYAWLL